MARAHTAVVAYDPVTNTVLTSATVNVYTPGTVTPIGVTIFDKNGNTLSNPLTSDATTGLVDFYLAVAQEVDLVVSKSSFTTRTYSNVPVLDDASNNLTALLTTTGQIIYASGNNTPAALGIGSTGAFLTVSGGVPAWSNTIASGGLSVTAGNVGIGRAAQTYALLDVFSGTMSGVTSYGIEAVPQGTSSNTTETSGVFAQPYTAASAYTSATVAGFHAGNPVKGSGSTITSAYGLIVDALTVGGTNNIGILVNAPSGATNNYGIQVLGGGVLITGATPTSPNSTTIAYGGTLGAPISGSATSLPTTKGSGFGPTTATGAGWVQFNSNGIMGYLPYWN